MTLQVIVIGYAWLLFSAFVIAGASRATYREWWYNKDEH